MRALNIRRLLAFSPFLLSLGCGGSASEESDGGVSSAGGSGTGGATSASCDVITTTAAQVGLCEAASACAKVECKSALATCMGDNFESGIYAGRDCSDYANCVKACNCESTCSANCALSQVCANCLSTTLLHAVIDSEHCAGLAYQCTLGG